MAALLLLSLCLVLAGCQSIPSRVADRDPSSTSAPTEEVPEHPSDRVDKVMSVIMSVLAIAFAFWVVKGMGKSHPSDPLPPGFCPEVYVDGQRIVCDPL